LVYIIEALKRDEFDFKVVGEANALGLVCFVGGMLFWDNFNLDLRLFLLFAGNAVHSTLDMIDFLALLGFLAGAFSNGGSWWLVDLPLLENAILFIVSVYGFLVVA
jgi:hypothetical protein